MWFGFYFWVKKVREKEIVQTRKKMPSTINVTSGKWNNAIMDFRLLMKRKGWSKAAEHFGIIKHCKNQLSTEKKSVVTTDYISEH
jgi:hypothetical protein